MRHRLSWILPLAALATLVSTLLGSAHSQATTLAVSTLIPTLIAKTTDCGGAELLQARTCIGDDLDAEEERLYELINQYRVQNGLPTIARSVSLSRVANRRVRDLVAHPQNFPHSWSNCSYDENDPATLPCMWEAPRRLGTPYPGKGFEIALGSSGSYKATAESVFRLWQQSSYHNDVLVNRNLWKTHKWQAIGIGIYKGYAVAWFGEEPEPMPGSTLATQTPVSDRDHFEQNFRAAQLEDAVRLIDQYRTQEFSRHLKLNAVGAVPTLAQIAQSLNQHYQSTGAKTALLYIVTLADRVELLLVLPHPKAIAAQNGTLVSSTALGRGLLTRNSAIAQQESSIVVRKVDLTVNRKVIQHYARELMVKIKDRRGSEDAYLKPAQDLYRTLIVPVLPELKANHIEALVISPDAGLRSLPMAALHDGRQFLVEQYSLSMIPSFTLAEWGSTSPQASSLLAMGISESTQGLPPLPAAAIEAKSLIGNLWQGQSIVNDQATINNLKSLSRQQKFDMIHLATHAEFVGGDLQESYIQFWNEKLSLNQLQQWVEMLQQNEHPIVMLVLSACRTALGDEQAELGFAGLAVKAGVKNAIGSLWYVSDEGSLALMSEFYRQLKTTPTKAEALRQAQLALLKGQVRLETGSLQLSDQTRVNLPSGNTIPKTGFVHPYFWAAFTVVGNGG